MGEHACVKGQYVSIRVHNRESQMREVKLVVYLYS